MNGFDVHIKFLEDFCYGWKISKKILPLNHSLEMIKSKKVLQSDNGEVK